MMKELGGPVPREDVPGIHQRRLESMARGAWVFKIIPEPGSGPAGTVCLWECDWSGSRIHEMGWTVLPAFQGRGLATAATRLTVERARREPRFRQIHAFPAVTNVASNAICRKLAFAQLEVCPLAYAGRPLVCNHWRLDLAAPGP